MQIKNRIKELRSVRAAELIPNPRNWREHPTKQKDALKGILAEVGFANALLARETPAGLMLIDGHARAEVAPDAIVPVLVLDVTEEEADKLLLTLDPIGAMATANKDALEALLIDASFKSDELSTLVDSLGKRNGIGIELDDGKEIDEEIADDVTLISCPKCGHEF